MNQEKYIGMDVHDASISLTTQRASPLECCRAELHRPFPNEHVSARGKNRDPPGKSFIRVGTGTHISGNRD
jgi:hypothetical protein